MDNNTSVKKNLALSAVLMIIYVATALIQYFVFGIFDFIALLETIGTLLLLSVLFIKVDCVYYYGAVLFAMFAQFGGAMLDFYHIIPIYDLLLHFFSGALLVFAANYLFKILIHSDKTYNIPRKIAVAFAVFTSIASAAIWEIFEFSVDQLFGLDCQLHSLTDTMTDIIAGSTGALIGGILLFLYIKKTVGKAYILNNSKDKQ